VAKRETITLVDDLDGGAADEHVQFVLDGRSYEIDLSSANSARLREALQPFLSAARRASRRRGGGTTVTRTASDREQNRAVREWAQRHGFEISERGRIPMHVVEAYRRNR
jgi:hypothetical protein